MVEDAITVEVYDSQGKRVALSSRLGEGGQGKVYRLADRDDQLAKIYKSAENLSERQARLEALLTKETERLAQVAAFPIQSLHDKSGETIGFLMENLKGWVPLHRIYQIKSRLSLMPESNFGTMIRVARNLATCVHYMHESDLVIGDLNESNALVAGNAMVKLIDSDSVQVKAPDKTYTCDVGRPELIAPELQGHSLTGRIRTVEEDRFALGVLIFQMLTFGRHPFAGQPRGSEEISLESAIKNKWYPFESKGNSRLKPPPGIELRYMSLEIRDLFERAFMGHPHERPTAFEWFVALEQMEESLEPCPLNKQHLYVDRGDGCPWCRFEELWRVPLFGSHNALRIQVPLIDVEAIWRKIEGIEAPTTYDIPEPVNLEQIVADAIPGAWIFKTTAWVVFGAVLVQLSLQWLATYSQVIPWQMVAPLWIVCLGLVTGTVVYGRLKVGSSKRRFEMTLAKYTEMLGNWNHETGFAVFDEAREGLIEAKEQLRTMEERRDERRISELKKLYRFELEAYLRKYSVLVADIGVSSKSVLSRLHDGGIKTAADLVVEAKLSEHKVGEQIARDLIEWRKRLEEAFWGSSPFQLSLAHEQRIEQEIERETEAFRRRLRRGPEELIGLTSKMESQQRVLGPQLHTAHYEVVQAAKEYKAWLNATGWSVPLND